MNYPRFRTMEEMEEFYYGPVSKAIRKADASIVATTTGFWQQVYGRKVWSYLNYEANAFAMIPKEPWGKSGWRVQTAAAASFPSGGRAEGATLPDTVVPTFATLYDSPKTVIHGFKVSEVAEFLSSVDDAIDILPYLRQEMGLEHARALSAYLVQDVDTPESLGFESLDRVASSKAECSHVSTASDPDIYTQGVNIDRSATTTYDAQVDSSGTGTGALRDLTISLIDDRLQAILSAGGHPKVILTNHNTIKVWSSLLEAERRYMDVGKVVPAYGGARGSLPGVEAGFNVALYNGIPIIPCQDYDSSLATARSGEIAPILFLDTDFLRLAIAKPTRYIETNLGEGMVAIDYLGIEGYYETMGQLRAYAFAFHGKLRDIK